MNDDEQMLAYLKSFEEFKRACRRNNAMMEYSERTIAILWLGYVITKKGVIA